MMKKVITFVLILCVGCLSFCGCKKDKDSNEANTSEGVDAVDVDDMGEETVVVDIETGSIFLFPRKKMIIRPTARKRVIVKPLQQAR